jgi:small subunit ribosomal protein S17
MPKRILQGPVVSNKGDKTVVVRVDRSYLHPLLKKVVRRSKRYHAHDEANSAKEGDVVQIIECAPKSKTKRWELYTPASETAQAEG